ncbi:DUF2764 family protein [Treponema zioleckii]|uniref:DUF2764 family protein n=1 Tax=Treponema zioleckii TaxID=331680 RepID=UPI00168B6B20|nr:DUF2764 family protein [Treponema zioleckii]
MSNQYYLVSQLPEFTVSDDRSNLPITYEYYYDLCSRFLDKKSMMILDGLSLEPALDSSKTGSKLVDSWNYKEKSLRLALAQIRALRMKKKFSTSNESIAPDAVQAARTASGMESPLAAEQFLNQYRLNVIESMRPTDGFSLDAVFSYGLRLKLATRMKKFNAATGMASYHKIYDSILKEGSSE